MPRYDRSQICKGAFIIGGNFAADGSLVDTRRSSLSEEFSHFKEAAAVAGRLAEFDNKSAANTAEIQQRLDNVRTQLNNFKKARGK